MVRIFKLQSSTVVLEKHCECTIASVSGVKKERVEGRNAGSVRVPPVTVGRHPGHDLFAQLFSRNRRIVEKTKLMVVAAVYVEEMALFGFTQAQSQA